MGLLRRLRGKKKVVKPKGKEYKRVTTRLLRKYPQMFEVAGSPAQMKAYRAAISSAERKELKRSMPLRMKRKYGKRPSS